MSTWPRTVAYVDQAGVTHSSRIDQLVIATGARPVVPDWALGPDGSPYGGVRPVKNLEDGAAWMSLFERPFGAPGETAGRVVITGGGYLGVEMAETALRLGYSVTLLTRSKVMGSLDPDMSDRIAAALTEAGVEVVENAEVAAVSTDDGWVRSVRSTGGDSYPCDLLVLALGVTPVTEFLSGLPLGDSGGLLADPRGRWRPESGPRRLLRGLAPADRLDRPTCRWEPTPTRPGAWSAPMSPVDRHASTACSGRRSPGSPTATPISRSRAPD